MKTTIDFGKIDRHPLGPDEIWEEEPEAIEWTHIAGGGEEIIKRGHFWAPAPPWRGNRGGWIREPREGEKDRFVLVVKASKRHECARLSPRGVILKKGGRWVDIGERYSDVSTRQPVRHPVSAGKVAVGKFILSKY